MTKTKITRTFEEDGKYPDGTLYEVSTDDGLVWWKFVPDEGPNGHWRRVWAEEEMEQTYRKVAEDRGDVLRCYTTAPDVYDGFGTVTVVVGAGETSKGTLVRAVLVLKQHWDWQTGRYASGLHMAASSDDWRKLVEYGLAKEVA
jgi:hypothetical protein